MGSTFDKKVNEFLENCLPRFTKEDLVTVLEDEGIPGTYQNILLFMDLNKDMKLFREAMIGEWFERMDAIARKDFDVYDKDEFPGTWKMDDIIFKVVPHGYGKADLYNLHVNDDLFSSGITSDEVIKYKDAMGYGRTVRRLS